MASNKETKTDKKKLTELYGKNRQSVIYQKKGDKEKNI